MAKREIKAGDHFLLPFAGAPRHTGNLNLFFARGPLDLRAFVNFRDPYLDGVGARPALDVYEDDRTTLNFFAKYKVNRRVTLENPEEARAALDAGHSIIIVTSHNCNWEWALLKLCLEMGHPVHATYKPLKGRWGDRLMMTIRSRFGAEMIPARRLLMRVMRYRGPSRVIAMVADQAPTSSGVRYFTQFMGLDTAFFIGPEAIAKAGKLPVFYIAMRRVSRGFYRIRFVQIAAAGEELPTGVVIERYAREIELLTLERPPDWLWNYRRWKVQRDAEGNPHIVKSGFIRRPD